jgi:hypothetical protein
MFRPTYGVLLYLLLCIDRLLALICFICLLFVLSNMLHICANKVEYRVYICIIYLYTVQVQVFWVFVV